MERLLVKPKEAFQAIGVGRSTGYSLIASGELKSIKVGRRLLVLVRGIEEYIARKLEERSGKV